MPEPGLIAPNTGESRGAAVADADTLYAPSAAMLEANAKQKRSKMGIGSRFVLLASLGLVSIVASVVGAIVLRSPSTVAALEGPDAVTSMPGADAGAPDASTAPSASASASPPPPSNRAPADALDQARTKDADALAALAERYPEDPDLLTALVVAYAREKTTYAKAMSTARKLFTAAPEKATDPDIKRVMLMVANGPVDVATIALEIMGSSMGSHGPDLLFELLLAPGIGKFPKDRASKLLADPAVKKRATPALVVANELRALTGCARKAVFPRAAKDGDERSLALLRPMLATKGCAWHRQADCYACLGDRAELRATIEAITARLGTSAP